MLAETVAYFSQIAVLELLAVITAFAYVIFAAKEHILCWPSALISTALYTYIFYDVYLWMDSLLQVYYFVMAIYGWYCWTKHKSNVKDICIHSLGATYHLKTVFFLAFVSIGVGYVMDNYTPTSFPYIDAATTVYAVFATYLVTQKVLENWLYWVVIDLVSIYVYIEKGLSPTAMLFVVYVVIALVGYFTWLEKLKQTPEPALN
ncbi:nicotinamide mononucleotide transporter [Thalassotalea sp. M1531]|uniref:Nicotinamide riboside transporter PnuC n=1 Tax=Thalassotalea algicola TaxID=2716224 RepID=A0A7Y0Q7K1_9GAMM|nr:nicotinamide riboside transporter PnuC [Thalassotalea algicola]NMP32301.1 nicotinamide mononucleotide transporter [Thalassotalea algicola]